MSVLLYLLTSQTSPVQPGVQVHSNLFTLSAQSPPLRHGLLEHSSISVIKLEIHILLAFRNHYFITEIWSCYLCFHLLVPKPSPSLHPTPFDSSFNVYNLLSVCVSPPQLLKFIWVNIWPTTFYMGTYPNSQQYQTEKDAFCWPLLQEQRRPSVQYCSMGGGNLHWRSRVWVQVLKWTRVWNQQISSRHGKLSWF